MKAINACGDYNVAPTPHTLALNLDFRLCDFQLSWLASQARDVWYTQICFLATPLAAMCKVVDVIRHPDSDAALAAEAGVYASAKTFPDFPSPHSGTSRRGHPGR